MVLIVVGTGGNDDSVTIQIYDGDSISQTKKVVPRRLLFCKRREILEDTAYYRSDFSDYIMVPRWLY